jgi:hypothetical protein
MEEEHVQLTSFLTYKIHLKSSLISSMTELLAYSMPHDYSIFSRISIPSPAIRLIVILQLWKLFQALFPNIVRIPLIRF